MTGFKRLLLMGVGILSLRFLALPADTPKSEWMGRYAMPVPESVNSLPSQEAGE